MNFKKSIKTGGDKLLNERLSAWGLSRSERGGGGNRKAVYRFNVELPENGDCTPIADDKSKVPD